jgi:hypothetical protein
LKNYIWQQKLNKLDCIILPFFRPVPATERNNEIQNIKSRLELLTRHNLAFRECDQSWRHVGHFNGKLYLFDLGDLETCEDKAAAEAKASCHAIRLTSKANGDVSTNLTTSINSSLQDHPSV